MSKRIKLSKLAQDDKNFNRHTVEGMELLSKSVDTVGVIESITVSNDDKIISGNARQTIMSSKFKDVDALVIETDGKRPIVLKRTDIESDTKEFHTAALLANTVSKKNVNLDQSMIQEIAVDEFDIDVQELGAVYVDPSGQTADFYDEEIDLSSHRQSADTYLNNLVRQIVLAYDQETHKQILEDLANIGNDFEIESDNSQVVKALIEFYQSKS